MISTPANPTAVAIQRRSPTFSPRNGIKSAVTSNGATKLVAEASAIGKNLKPEIKSSDEPSTAAPRHSCRRRWPVRNAYSGDPGTMAGTMISAKIRNRIQAISIEGSVVDSYFDVTSDVPRKTVAARSNAMPRSGRSARAGALLASFFSGNGFSGSGKGALSSLTAAAERVTLNSGPKRSNRARIHKRPVAAVGQHPKTGSGYALVSRIKKKNRKAKAKKEKDKNKEETNKKN